MINNHSISLCLVVYQQSDLAENAINSVKENVDEIVIVDQGSDKEHSEKLRSLATIYQKTTNKGNGDYDRQFCYALASKEFILTLDADEYITPQNIEKIKTLFTQYGDNFDVVWFLFNNNIKFDGVIIDLKKMLGDDPHPRLWRRVIKTPNGEVPTILWSQEAHQFPHINSQKQIFSQIYFKHFRDLNEVIKTHLRRTKNINPQAGAVEKKFIQSVLEEFGNDIKLQMRSKFPELREYLTN